ncbi:MAG: helix-turn-helix domain-containing protein [Bacteroidetes bacterium]|nr:helix-turn-helix domain-containing protein [Bacteroidota bacterium]
MEDQFVTKEDLQIFRMQLLDDIKRALTGNGQKQEVVEWLKSNEVRKFLKSSASTLQNLRISGKLNPVKIAGTWYYRRSEIISLFEQNNPGGVRQ